MSTGLTMKKNTAAAIAKNVIRSVMNAPYMNTDLWIVNVRSLKFGLPTIAAMIGITRFFTNELIIAANATPMTNATASWIRLPRIRKSRNSLSVPLTIPPIPRSRPKPSQILRPISK